MLSSFVRPGLSRESDESDAGVALQLNRGFRGYMFQYFSAIQLQRALLHGSGLGRVSS
jgi:hypothetical protein